MKYVLKFDWKANLPSLLAYGLLAWIGFIALGIWLATAGFPSITDQGEVFFAHLTAKNFLRFGAWENYFLDDTASSPEAAAHPMNYTHNFNLVTKFLSYALMGLGVTDIRWLILLAIPIFLLGQWYFYQLSRRFLGETGGLWVLFFAATGYWMSLSWSINFYRAWSWVLFCGALYHLTAIGRGKGKRSDRTHGVFFLFWLLLLAGHYYSFALFFTIVVFGLKGFDLLQWSWRRLALCWLLVPGGFFAFHQWLVIRWMGWDNWWRSWIYTIGNRTFGVPSRSEIQGFYDRVGLALWGYESGQIFSRDELNLFWQRMGESLGSVGARLVVGGSVALLLLALWRSWRGRKKRVREDWELAVRFLGALALGVLAMAFIGPRDFMLVSVQFFFPLIIFFAYPCLAFILILLSHVPEKIAQNVNVWQYKSATNVSIGTRKTVLMSFSIGWPKCPKAIASLGQPLQRFIQKQLGWANVVRLVCIGLILVPYTHAQVQSWNRQPPQMLPAAEVLAKYEGHTFISNTVSAYVSYFTHNWSIFLFPSYLDRYPLERDDLKMAFERDKLVNPEYRRPEFYLCTNMSAVGTPFDCFATAELEERFPIVEVGEEWRLYDLRGEP